MSSGQEVGDIFAYGKGPATALLRSPTVIIASIALWGMNILLFRLFGIDHVRVLTGSSVQNEENKHGLEINKDLENPSSVGVEGLSSLGAKKRNSLPEITASKCFFLSSFLYALLNITTYIWMTIFDGTTIGAIFVYYLVIFIGIMVPLKSTQWIRNGAGVVFYRATELFNPRCACITNEAPTPVPFIDVFFADGMCSLSKVFFDWGMLWHLASHYPQEVPNSVHSIVIPSTFAALPYLIRARQCIVMFNVGKVKNDPKRYQHALNAIKYSTSLFPICVSAYQKTIPDEDAVEYLIVSLLIINSIYSYLWDIIMDWGMMQNPTLAMTHSCSPIPGSGVEQNSCSNTLLRPRLRFGTVLSTIILLADGIFRFGWVLRFYESYIFISKDSYILFTELLEVFRRSIWNLLRVEWENIKQMRNKDPFDNHAVEDDDSTIQLSPLVR